MKKWVYNHLLYLLSPLPFLKKALPSNPHPFHKLCCVHEIYDDKIQVSELSASFQMVWRIVMPKLILLPLLQNHYSLYWKMKSPKQVYFVNIRLFSRIFCKNRFYSFIRNLLQGVISKYCIFCNVSKYRIFSNVWPVLWHASSE